MSLLGIGSWGVNNMTDTNSNVQGDKNTTAPVAEAKVEPKVETTAQANAAEAKTEEKKELSFNEKVYNVIVQNDLFRPSRSAPQIEDYEFSLKPRPSTLRAHPHR